MDLAPVPDESALVAALRGGDERAFSDLVDRHTPGLLRVARLHVRDREAAEDVVQETWLALLHGLDGFEQRSSLRTWLYRVVANRARTRGTRDARTRTDALPEGGPSVDPGRFLPDDAPAWPGHWADPPPAWQRDPQVQAQSAEVMAVVREAVLLLPDRQRDVLVLRDVRGLTTDEAAAELGLTPGNARVLLHRGRTRVRQALEGYLS